MRTRRTAGWRERADFPDWGLAHVRVKLDTGARTTAVGVTSCELVPGPGGQDAVLTVVPDRNRPDKSVVVRVPVVGFTTVRNSSGETERRPVVETTLVLGPVTKRIRATVADRSRMLVGVILGRSALDPDFVVDSGRKYVLSRRPGRRGGGAACGS